MRARIGRILRRLADRIDYAGAPKAVGLTFTFEEGRGAVLHGEFGSIRSDRRGCMLWYLGDAEYDKAFTEATRRPVRVNWATMRPYYPEDQRPAVPSWRAE